MEYFDSEVTPTLAALNAAMLAFVIYASDIDISGNEYTQARLRDLYVAFWRREVAQRSDLGGSK